MNPSGHNLLREISVRADASEVRVASSWLESTSLAQGVPADQVGRLDICLNEALANIISHSGINAETFVVSISLEVHREKGAGQAKLTVSDSGSPFDPTSAYIKPRPSILAEAEPGGVGLLMMRNNADALSYNRINGQNQVKFSVYWNEAS